MRHERVGEGAMMKELRSVMIDPMSLTAYQRSHDQTVFFDDIEQANRWHLLIETGVIARTAKLLALLPDDPLPNDGQSGPLA